MMLLRARLCYCLFGKAKKPVPVCGERLAKYNRLSRIEEEIA